ncbi:hypothetical protein AZH43_00970 [Acinetobacter pragensis]|uniref:Uncharacterized protein n=1 Tax=Acinetobacter pragensis TaxID=1806892 RepID=A0A151Y6T5_9GAMM|nr:hypothetical protein AZH43_00970 [Acinetobacter pragensis]
MLFSYSLLLFIVFIASAQPSPQRIKSCCLHPVIDSNATTQHKDAIILIKQPQILFTATFTSQNHRYKTAVTILLSR